MALISVFILALSFLNFATPFEILEGCMVRNEIIENVTLYDSMEFLVFNNNQRDEVLNMLINCHEKDFIRLKGTSPVFEVTKSFANGGNTSTQMILVPLSNGWQKFLLNFRDEITLNHEIGHSWSTVNLSNSCDVKTARITNGNFTRLCPTETPTWQVKGSRVVEIPVQKGSQNLSFFSKNPYTPVLNISGKLTELGNYLHLEQFILDFQEDNGGCKLQVWNANQTEIFSTVIKDFPTSMHITGNEKNEEFLLIQYINHRATGSPTDKAEQRENTSNGFCLNGVIYGLAGGLSFVTICFVSLLIHHVRTLRKDKNAASSNSASHPQGTNQMNGLPNATGFNYASPALGQSTNALPITSGAFVHHQPDLAPPLPLTAPPIRCLTNLAVGQQQRDTGEDVEDEDQYYCEMEPVLIYPPNSFVADVRGECVETINDIYESADGY